MKKVFFLIALLFTVVCYAAPPPDIVFPDIVTGQSAFVVQDNQIIAEYTFVSIGVAFVDIGNLEYEICYSEYAEQVNDVVLPIAKVTDVSCFRLNELNKPPAVNRNRQVFNFNPDKQNSNYGYPLTGDTCRS